MEFFFELSILTLCLLFLVACLAGWVDSIAGGGGLIVVPSLMVAGLPPHLALATNKACSWGATLMATIYFVKKGLVNPRETRLMIVTCFAGACLGSALVFYIDPDILNIFVPIMLMAVGIFFLVKKDTGKFEGRRRLSAFLFSVIIVPALAFYDGFFGPGTGTFFTLAFILLAGYQIIKATAHAKILNLTSNLSSLLYFSIFEEVVWGLGLIMLCGQALGAFIGAKMVVGMGGRIIRPLLVIVCFALAGKLLMDVIT